jgi:hypothetical protein
MQDQTDTKLIQEKKENIPHILKFSFKSFIKFYGIRAALSLIQLLLKGGLKKLNISKIIKALFNISNIKTAVFLTLMPTLYKLLEYLTSNNIKKDMLLTFINGTISSFIAILFSEKNNFMTFILISVFVRSLHSLLTVILAKKGLPTQSRLVTFFLFLLANIGFLFINFYNPTFHPVSHLFANYANFMGNEKLEIKSLTDKLRIV